MACARRKLGYKRIQLQEPYCLDDLFISSPWEAMGLQTIVSNIFCFELLPTWMHPSILWLMDCDETLRTVSGQLFRRVYALSYKKHSEYSQWISANKQDNISWAILSVCGCLERTLALFSVRWNLDNLLLFPHKSAYLLLLFMFY